MLVGFICSNLTCGVYTIYHQQEFVFREHISQLRQASITTTNCGSPSHPYSFGSFKKCFWYRSVKGFLTVNISRMQFRIMLKKWNVMEGNVRLRKSLKEECWSIFVKIAYVCTVKEYDDMINDLLANLVDTCCWFKNSMSSTSRTIYPKVKNGERCIQILQRHSMAGLRRHATSLWRRW